MNKIYNPTWGWGEVIAETETTIVVRFDADPWYPRTIRK